MTSLALLAPILPVFLLIVIGFFFAHWKKIDLSSITEIIVYLAAPCLVFTSLTTKPLFAADVAVIFLGAVGILGGVGLLIRFYFALFGFSSRGFALPVLFMNAGNMGLPLALFGLGEPGLHRATLLFAMISFFNIRWASISSAATEIGKKSFISLSSMPPSQVLALIWVRSPFPNPFSGRSGCSDTPRFP